MALSPTPTIDATTPLTDPEWLVFDDHPELFVDLTRTPIVFTVRGIAHFSPQFQRLGVSLNLVSTRTEFENFCTQASMLQMEDLAIRINEHARSSHCASEYKVLDAFLNGNSDEVALQSRRLSHLRSAKLHAV